MLTQVVLSSGLIWPPGEAAKGEDPTGDYGSFLFPCALHTFPAHRVTTSGAGPGRAKAARKGLGQGGMPFLLPL